MSHSHEYQNALPVMFMLLTNFFNLYLTGNLIKESGKKVTRIIAYCVACGFSFILTWLVLSVCNAMNITSFILILSFTGVLIFLASKLVLMFLKTKNKKEMLMFTAYLVALMFVTFTSRFGNHQEVIKLNLMDGIKEVMEKPFLLEHLLLNIAMFIPFGFLLATAKKDRHIFVPSILGFLVSVCIECSQLIFSLGQCDIMDIAGNGFGGIIGIIIYFIMSRFLDFL